MSRRRRRRRCPTTLLPPPPDLGLPPAFISWRQHQPEAVEALCSADTRFTILNSPVGIGKTVIYSGWATINGERTLFLTSTRGLQDQLYRDMEPIGFRLIRGSNNYLCDVLADRSKLSREEIAARATRSYLPTHLTCDKGPCRGGEMCALKLGGCDYYDAVSEARGGQWVVGNYSYHMHQSNYGGGALGDFPALVCDEAHNLEEEIARFLRTTIHLDEVRSFIRSADFLTGTDAGQWAAWAQVCISAMPPEIDFQGDAERVRRHRSLSSQLTRLASLPPESVVELVQTRDEHYVTAEPVWPGKLSQDVLFQDAQKIILSSATIRPKTLDLLGIPAEDCTWHDSPSPFDPRRRPFTWLHTGARLTSRNNSWMVPWLRKIDAYIERRLDRKGIIHAVSYTRARDLAQRSRHGQHMLVHTSQNAAATIARFRSMRPPAILVSPSVTTGYDFPGDDARWQIIAKVPFPDTRAPVLAARCDSDKDYQNYLTMVQIVQAYGRVCRSPEDWGETVIVDDQWSWFRKRARQHAAKWFWEAVDEVEMVPDPIPFH